MSTATLPAECSNYDYHADRSAISNSARELFRTDPQRFGLWLRGELPRTETDEMRLGTALHAVLFEPESIEIVQATTCDEPIKSGPRKGQPCGATAKTGHAKCGVHGGVDVDPEPGTIRLTGEQAELLEAMAAQARRHKFASVLLETAVSSERTYTWRDPDSGLLLKCRPDIYHPKSCVDLKTTRVTCDRARIERAYSVGADDDLRQAERRRQSCPWSREVRQRGYHRQAAFYLMVLRGCGAADHRTDWRWITVSNQPPCPYVDVWRISAYDLQAAERQVRADLIRLADRLERDDWQQEEIDWQQDRTISLPDYEGDTV